MNGMNSYIMNNEKEKLIVLLFYNCINLIFEECNIIDKMS